MTEATIDTIQEDVSSVEIQENQEPIILSSELEEPEMNEDDPRAAIYAKYDQKRAEELGAPPVAVEVKPAEEKAPVKDDEVTVKVNGKERKVSKAKVDEAGGIKAYQKTAAADEMLRQASEELRKARELESELTGRLAAITQQEEQIKTRAQQPASAVLPDEGALKDMARKYHEAIMDGDMDTADLLLVKIQTARNPATADEDAIVRKAAAAARADMVREQQEAKQRSFEKERVEVVQQFDELYPDIAEDPELRRMADAKTIDIFNEHPDWGPKKIIETATAQVRDWLSGRSVAPASSDKLEAKRAQTTIRSGSAKAISRPAPKPQTHSQYVESLRKARGLST